MFGELKKLAGEKIINDCNLNQRWCTVAGGEYDCPGIQKVGNSICPEWV